MLSIAGLSKRYGGQHAGGDMALNGVDLEVPKGQLMALIGPSGAGKSTLARALGARLGLPVIHIDTLFWKPGWVEGDREVLRGEVEAAVRAEHWITEGNFIDASALRFARADTIVWVDLPRLACLWRAVRRAVTGFGQSRPDLAPGCPEKIDLAFYGYIWSWNRLMRPKTEAAITQFGSRARLVRLRSDREMAAWLAAIEARDLPGVEIRPGVPHSV